MVAKRHLIIVSAIVGMTVTVVPGATAETATGNDDIAGATVLSVPQSVSQDTAGATANPTDPVNCWGVTHTPTVWFKVTAPTAGQLAIYSQTFDANHDYGPHYAVYSGAPGALQLIGCGVPFSGADEEVKANVEAGQTLYIMSMVTTSADLPDSVFVSTRYVPPPTPDPHVTTFTMGSTEKVTKAGKATVGGTIRCRISGTASVQVHLTQRFGRSTARGQGNVTVPCTTTATHWSMRVKSSTAVRFDKGKATVTGSASTAGELGSTERSVTHQVSLRPQN